MNESPNVYTVLIALIQMIGTAFAVFIAYKQTIAHNRAVAATLATKVEETNATSVAVNLAAATQTARKLDEVHKTVNGNLDSEKRKVANLTRALRLAGVDPDAVTGENT